MKLFKIFKTHSGVRLEIAGRSDENLKVIPFIVMLLNFILVSGWVIEVPYKREHIFTAGGTNAYEYVCSGSLGDTVFLFFMVVFNALIYCYAIFLSYILKTNKIFTKQTRYMIYILYNALFFMILGVIFGFTDIFNRTTKRIILSIFMFMATNLLFLLFRSDIDKQKHGQKSKSKNTSNSNHEIIDRSTLGSMVKLNQSQTADNTIFYDYVEILDKKFNINVWRRFFLLFNGNDKFISLHTIKKMSSNNEYQLKSEGTVYKLDFCLKPVLIEDLDRKNKIKVILDNGIELTIVFSNEDMVRKFKLLMNYVMSAIRSKFSKNGIGLQTPGIANSYNSVKSSEDLRRNNAYRNPNSLENIKKGGNTGKSIEDLKRSRNL